MTGHFTSYENRTDHELATISTPGIDATRPSRYPFLQEDAAMSQATAGVAWPVTDGTRVPFEIYTSQQVFDREQERIFRGPLWNYVALEAEIPVPGDFKTSFVGDTPVVVSRAQDGGVHVFVNRCAHRGATVQRHASGNTKEHRCVYHQWCYD